MKTYLSLVSMFGVLSLLSIGGGNTVLPEMHLQAVGGHHWLTNGQFADIFSISQAAPGPSILIVSLVGYAAGLKAAGVLGGVIGGVVAARHYAPDFDLNGVPRLDVTAQTGTDPAWVTSLDPALRLATMQERSPVLVVHQSRRSRAMDDGKEGGIGSFASPAETLLDLYELRLTEQADDFVRSMRRKGDRHG